MRVEWRPAVLAAFLAAGCAFSTDIPTLTLTFTFAGSLSCPPDVDHITIGDATNILPERTLSCSEATSSGLGTRFTSVPPRTYTLYVKGWPSEISAVATWAFLGPVTVTRDAPNTFPIDLSAAASSVSFDFTFGASGTVAGLTCAQAQVTTLTVVVDSGQATSQSATVQCHDPGANMDRAAITGVTPGTHDFDVFATDARNVKAWEVVIPAQAVTLAGPNELTTNLQPLSPGPLAMTWAFPSTGSVVDGGLIDGGTLESCTMAGVATIEYQLYNPDGSYAMSGTIDCANADGTTMSLLLDSLTAGDYAVTLQGCPSDGASCTWQSQGYPSPESGVIVLPDDAPNPIPVILMSPI